MHALYQPEDPNPKKPSHRKKRKRKQWRTKGERADQTNKQALIPLLKPASPTSSNMLLPISLHRDPEGGIEVLRYCEVLHRGGA